MSNNHDQISQYLNESLSELIALQRDVKTWSPPYSVAQIRGFIHKLDKVNERITEVETSTDEPRILMELYDLIHSVGNQPDYNLVALEECAHILEAYLANEQVTVDRTAAQVSELRHRLSQSIVVLRHLIRSVRGDSYSEYNSADDDLNSIDQPESAFGSRKKVFISYNHHDKEVALRLKDALEENEIEVVIDVQAMPVGSDITEFIENSIRNTEVTLSIVSNKSLLSSWVALETVNTFYHIKFREDKKFIACYIEDDFFERGFTLKAIHKIDDVIREIEDLIPQYANKKIDTADLNSEKTRLYNLRNNLDKIIAKLKDSLCVDIRDDKFSSNLPKIVKAIKG